MKATKSTRKGRSDGGAQALNIGPRGVTDKDSPTINSLKRKPRARGNNRRQDPQPSPMRQPCVKKNPRDEDHRRRHGRPAHQLLTRTPGHGPIAYQPPRYFFTFR